MPTSAWTWGPEPDGAAERPAEPRSTATLRWREPPRYTSGDVAAMVWRQWPLMLIVFLLIALVGGVIALRMPKTWPAQSSLLIRLGQEYVYDPRVGDAGRGAAPSSDQVVQSELAILQSAAVKERTVRDVGVGRFDPALGRAYAVARDEAGRRDVEAQAVRVLEGGLKVASVPDNAVVRLTYAAKDPVTAALVLNTLVDEYLRFRKTVLLEHDVGALAQQRRAFQSRLESADGDYQRFLSANGIGDYEAEKTSLAALYGQLLTDSYSVQAQLSEVQGRLGVTARAAAGAPPEIGLYRDVDHAAQDKLLQLRIDRQDMLSRYQPTAQPVRDIDAKIAAQERLIASGQATTGGARRVGVNPIYQTFATEKVQLEAQAASLRERRAAVDAEISQVIARRQKLAGLDPQNQALVRQRELLAANARTFAQREQDAEAAQALAQSGSDNIRVVERAYPPTKPTSLRRPVLLITLVFAAFAAICAGLLRAFLTPGYPTSDAVERELELPVLAEAPAKRP